MSWAGAGAWHSQGWRETGDPWWIWGGPERSLGRAIIQVPSALCCVSLSWHLGEWRVEFHKGARFHRTVESPGVEGTHVDPQAQFLPCWQWESLWAGLGAPFLLQVRRLLPGRRQLPGPAIGSRGGSGGAGAPGAAQHHPGTARLSPWLSSGGPSAARPLLTPVCSCTQGSPSDRLLANLSRFIEGLDARRNIKVCLRGDSWGQQGCGSCDSVHRGS